MTSLVPTLLGLARQRDEQTNSELVPRRECDSHAARKAASGYCLHSLWMLCSRPLCGALLRRGSCNSYRRFCRDMGSIAPRLQEAFALPVTARILV
jgi:hypothetical protein